MLPTSRLSLKKGKEKPILQRHHWIYSGAIASIEKASSGDLLEVFSSSKERLGLAFYNPNHSIAAHMIAYGEESLEASLKRRMQEASFLRKKLFDPKKTNAIRLINAEGDGLPGLIVDSYADVLVVQISHPGLENIKEKIFSLLIEIFGPKAILEKSTSFLRKKEGLREIKERIYGEEISEVEVLENGIRFFVPLLEGQKTGLFLDQREMRLLVRELSSEKRVLNCFAYTGGFSVAALLGKAKGVTSVEISEKCKGTYEKNLALNNLEAKANSFHTEDVFEFLKKDELNYDLIILDPPAFVKKRQDIAAAFRAYKEMNRAVIERAKPGTLLLTCSCSYHVEESLFQNILFRASVEAKRSVQIIGKHRQALDHPISIYHPESSYLKSSLLFVN